VESVRLARGSSGEWNGSTNPAGSRTPPAAHRPSDFNRHPDRGERISSFFGAVKVLVPERSRSFASLKDDGVSALGERTTAGA
jgi:hypothetical protein